VFLGEGPGEHEDEEGRPFVGRSGALLRNTLRQVGFDPTDAYLSNTVMCRPPDNRDPLADELAECRPRLMEQIRLLDPLMVVSLGKIASQAVLHTSQAVRDLRGRMFRLPRTVGEVKYFIPVYVTYHPAFLLRSPAKLSEWEKDLSEILAILTQTKELICPKR